MHVSSSPLALYAIDAVLGSKEKAKASSSTVTPSCFFTKLWLRETAGGDRIFWLGTNRLTGERMLLLDSHAFERLQRDATVRLPPSLLPSQATTFFNLSEYPIRCTKKLRNKMGTLRLEGFRRKKSYQARWNELRSAMDAVEETRSVLALSVTATSGGRNGKKVLEIGWARWDPDGNGRDPDVDELASFLETSMRLEPRAAKSGHATGQSSSPTKSVGTSVEDATISVAHVVCQEHEAIRNRRFPGRGEDFEFGLSTTLPFDMALASLRALIDSAPSGLAIVFSASPSPVDVLGLQDYIAGAGIPTFELAKLFHTAKRNFNLPSTVAAVAQAYGVPHEAALKDHAGCDAIVMLQAFLALTTTEPRS
ncbi:hypothetical protein RQP46_006921 [Phenoliferia psychrophenolica]